MAVEFTNNFKNILDKLRGILRDEFKGTMPIYIGSEDQNVGTQYMKIDPVRSTLLEYTAHSETREFNINVLYVFSEANVKKTSLDHVLRFVSRTEALIHDNITMTLSDSSRAFNCRFESTELNTDDDESKYVVQWVWKCSHLGNTG